MSSEPENLSSTRSDAPPDRLLAPWWRSGLLLLESRPFAKVLLDKYIVFIFFSYPTLVALAESLDRFHRWSWLERWLQVSRPAVELLRPILPVFHSVGSQFVANGIGYDVTVAQHLYVFCYLVGTPILIFLCITIWRRPRHEWLRLVRVVPQRLLYGVLVGAMFLVPSSVYWVAWDAPNRGFPFFLFLIGPVFAGIIVFVVSGVIALGAIIEGDRVRAEQRLMRSQRRSPLN